MTGGHREQDRKTKPEQRERMGKRAGTGKIGSRKTMNEKKACREGLK